MPKKLTELSYSWDYPDDCDYCCAFFLSWGTEPEGGRGFPAFPPLESKEEPAAEKRWWIRRSGGFCSRAAMKPVPLTAETKAALKDLGAVAVRDEPARFRQPGHDCRWDLELQFEDGTEKHSSGTRFPLGGARLERLLDVLYDAAERAAAPDKPDEPDEDGKFWPGEAVALEIRLGRFRAAGSRERHFIIRRETEGDVLYDLSDGMPEKGVPAENPCLPHASRIWESASMMASDPRRVLNCEFRLTRADGQTLKWAANEKEAAPFDLLELISDCFPGLRIFEVPEGCRSRQRLSRFRETDPVLFWASLALDEELFGNVLQHGGLKTFHLHGVLKSVREALKADDPRCARLLARSLETEGESCPAEALRLYRKAAEAGDARAMYRLYELYADGDAVRQDDKASFSWCLKAAEAGCEDAFYDTACCYQEGTGVRKDPAKALLWFRKGAEAGDPACWHALGCAYDAGENPARDPEVAAECFRKGHVLGHALSTLRFGHCCFLGRGVKKNRRKAASLFHEAARRGLLPAQVSYASCLLYGSGIPVDKTEALRWCRLAAEQGNEAARQTCEILEEELGIASTGEEPED